VASVPEGGRGRSEAVCGNPDWLARVRGVGKLLAVQRAAVAGTAVASAVNCSRLAGRCKAKS
jgi:hypothetical protein